MSEPGLNEIFTYIRSRAEKILPVLGKVRLHMCREADGEHRRSSRQYAHYNHHRLTICVSKHILELSPPWLVGLIAHEFGHAYADETVGNKHSEADADRYGSMILGAKSSDSPKGVKRKGPQNLEWASVPEELLR